MPINYGQFNRTFGDPLQGLLLAAQQAGYPVGITGGYRTWDQQADLYRRKPKLAAPPGRSLHQAGYAADLDYQGSDAARQYIHENAARFGLEFPMDYEPWHIIPQGLDREAALDSIQQGDVSRPTSELPLAQGQLAMARQTGGGASADAYQDNSMNSLLDNPQIQAQMQDYLQRQMQPPHWSTALAPGLFVWANTMGGTPMQMPGGMGGYGGGTGGGMGGGRGLQAIAQLYKLEAEIAKRSAQRSIMAGMSEQERMEYLAGHGNALMAQKYKERYATPEVQEPTTAQQNYEYLISQGYTPEQAAAAEFGVEPIGGIPEPVDTTDAQQASAAFAVRMVDASQAIGALPDPWQRGTEGLPMSPGMRWAAYGPKGWQTEDTQIFETNKQDWINSMLRRESGAAIGDIEYDRIDTAYWPQPGDSQATVAEKQRKRRVVNQTMIDRAGPAWGQRTMPGDASTTPIAPPVGGPVQDFTPPPGVTIEQVN